MSSGSPVTRWDDGPGVVVLPDGRRVRGRGLRRPLPDAPPPTFGVYLLGKEPGPFPWAHAWVRWPDFRTPADDEQAVRVLRDAHARAADERVELACGGGSGRTGTALAILAVLSGVPVDDAVDWVRAHYRKGAVETPWQRRWVRTAGRRLEQGAAAG